MDVPERLSWAVEKLAVRPGDHILEIGCGRGVAVALVCDRLNGGRIAAIDRSAKATAAAADRNAEHVASGRAVLHTVALEELDLAETFDKIFAVNVNLFWTRSAFDELQLIQRLLRPGGALYVFYEPPGPGQAAHTSATVGANLEQAGFSVAVTTKRAHSSATLLCLRAQPHAA